MRAAGDRFRSSRYISAPATLMTTLPLAPRSSTSWSASTIWLSG